MKNNQNNQSITENKKAYQQVDKQVEKAFESGDFFVIVVEKEQGHMFVDSLAVVDIILVFAENNWVVDLLERWQIHNFRHACLVLRTHTVFVVPYEVGRIQEVLIHIKNKHIYNQKRKVKTVDQQWHIEELFDLEYGGHNAIQNQKEIINCRGLMEKYCVGTKHVEFFALSCWIHIVVVDTIVVFRNVVVFHFEIYWIR